jgi:hypothetical protein
LPKFARRPSKAAGLNNAGEQFQRIGIQPSQGLETQWGRGKFTGDWFLHVSGLYTICDLV